VDQSGFEPPTSPVRGVRKPVTAVYSESHLCPFTQVALHFPVTSTSMEFRVFPYVMLGVSWEQIEQKEGRARTRFDSLSDAIGQSSPFTSEDLSQNDREN
jgi:hypothetical protein